MKLPGGLLTLLRRADVDRSVAYGALTPLSRLVSGPVTGLLVLLYFTPELQGYYYTFGSLLALQVLAELGLWQVIVQFASHEWSRLSLTPRGTLEGDAVARSRLQSLGRFALRWYLVAGALAGVALVVGGGFFLSRSPSSNVSWEGPWAVLCLLTVARLCLLPLWSLLEGCNQVAAVYRFRLTETLLGTLVCWIALVSRCGLWVPVWTTAATVAWSVSCLWRGHFALFRELRGPAAGSSVDWRNEIWPLQWRIALSWLSGYFTFSLFTPVLFQCQGAVEAGRMGLSWSLVSIVSGVASSWVITRAPRFGILVAERRWADLDALFYRLTLRSMAVAVALASGILLLIGVLFAWHLRYAARLLPPLPTALFLAATLFQQVSVPQSVYLRAHKREPFLVPSVVAGLCVAASDLLTAPRWGATGMAAGYLGVQVAVLAWCTWIWARCRAEWHGGGAGEPVLAGAGSQGGAAHA